MASFYDGFKSGVHQDDVVFVMLNTTQLTGIVRLTYPTITVLKRLKIIAVNLPMTLPAQEHLQPFSHRKSRQSTG